MLICCWILWKASRWQVERQGERKVERSSLASTDKASREASREKAGREASREKAGREASREKASREKLIGTATLTPHTLVASARIHQ
jgi:hypothetical protein